MKKSLSKNLFLSVALLFSTQAFACQMGDTSKTLLILPESADGEENKVIAEIESGGQVQIDSQDYVLSQKTSTQVSIRGYDGITYNFELSHAKQTGSYCFPVIFADSGH